MFIVYAGGYIPVADDRV